MSERIVDFFDRRSLADVAVMHVRDQITSGHLRPGARVRPEVVAEELGISSTPAREALQALRAEGFLEQAPRRGFTVARLTGDDIRDVYFVQATIAGELAARAAQRATPHLVEHLEEIHNAVTTAAQRRDLAALEESNYLFHREVNLAARSPKLARLIQLTSRYAPRRFYPTLEGWAEATVDDHAGLLDAIRTGDGERARAETSEHIRRAGEMLARHIDARMREDAS